MLRSFSRISGTITLAGRFVRSTTGKAGDVPDGSRRRQFASCWTSSSPLSVLSVRDHADNLAG